MSFGGQTVTFVTFTLDGVADNLGIKAEQSTEVEVTGCRFRPLTAAETADTEFDVATEIWKCTAPPTSTVLAADSTGYLRCDGDTYAIVGGPQLFPDMNGQPFKVTILAQKHNA